jgi:dipeptidyl aminopeptidase/acylaminoacyl peptidase
VSILSARNVLTATAVATLLALALHPIATRSRAVPRAGLTLCTASGIGRSQQWGPETATKRAVNVEDVIRMTRVAGPDAIDAYGGSLARDFASYSPDGKWVVIVLKKGNVEENTNEYSLLLFAVRDLCHSPSPRILVSFSSSSNRAAIDEVTWLEDNNTILFLGERPSETTQLYSVERSSGKIQRLTDHPTNLLSYSVSGHADRLAYFAERPPAELQTEQVRRQGFHVSDQRLSDLITGKLQDFRASLFWSEGPRFAATEVPISDIADDSPLSLSPDGRYLLIRTLVALVPKGWLRYREPLLQHEMLQKLPAGVPSQVQQYTLVNLTSGASHALLNAPLSYYGSEVQWLPDSRSIVVSGVYLPLDSSDESERTQHPYTAEIDIGSGEISQLGNKDMRVSAWDAATQTLTLSERSAKVERADELLRFRKDGKSWSLLNGVSEGPYHSLPEIFVQQDLNTPPRLFVNDHETGRRAELLDLNPEFTNLVFGKIEIVKWTAGDHREIEGGLYLPPDYVPGKRYPLVIQTHGFDSSEFWMDGPFSTAFAAQPLAAKGIVVLQVPDSHDWNIRDTPQEDPMMMATFEAAIDYLDKRGVIDPSRIGLIGFSQTCLYVQYTLTHSRYKFAAAVVADGIDGGYFQYMAFANSSPYMESIREGLIGKPPFGDGLKVWLDRSPGFLLDRVKAPIFIQAIRPTSVPDEWEWFAGLSRLNKPVDFVYIPNGYHILQKPWDRIVSQQGAVDWFSFWLKGEEDEDSQKIEQYKRWRALRELKNRAKSIN